MKQQPPERAGHADGAAPRDRPAYAFAAGVVRQEVAGEMVLLDTGRQLYFGLDRVGADVVTRLVSSSWDDTLAELARAYDVDPAVLQSDVSALVTDLRDAGLLRVVTREA